MKETEQTESYDLKIKEVLDSPDAMTVSDWEFIPSYMDRYSHWDELRECCELALAEMAEEPYLGHVSNAKVMGRAMELLRKKYRLDAPRGWVIVLRKLRASGAKLPSTYQSKG